MLIHDDSLPEGNETVVITLSSATATIGTNRITTVTILDDEPALTFSAPAYSATEGPASKAIPILRAGPTPAGTTVTCRTVPVGSAIPDVDYRAVTHDPDLRGRQPDGHLHGPAAERHRRRTGHGPFNLALSVPPTQPGPARAPATAVLTLNDNDQGGTIKFGAATYTVAEGATARLTVTRTGTRPGQRRHGRLRGHRWHRDRGRGRLRAGERDAGRSRGQPGVGDDRRADGERHARGGGGDGRGHARQTPPAGRR